MMTLSLFYKVACMSSGFSIPIFLFRFDLGILKTEIFVADLG